MGEQVRVLDKADLIQQLVEHSFLFRGMDHQWLRDRLPPDSLMQEKLYSSRAIFNAFQPDTYLDCLYIILKGGPVVLRSTPLDRIIAMTYAGGAFGMRNLSLGCGQVMRAFPSLVEAYKTTDVVKIPLRFLQILYDESEVFRTRYGLLLELREKFQYHLLNCSAYPPQAVAALLRALVYQERSLGTQPDPDDTFRFDLPVDIISHACQLNHRTVEQVLKGMGKQGILKSGRVSDSQGDWVCVANPEGLKGVYSSTRDKVSWWPLK